MQYLTLLRMQIAARVLADGSTKVAAVGREIGYLTGRRKHTSEEIVARLRQVDVLMAHGVTETT